MNERQREQARSALANVQPSQVDAMRRLEREDPATLLAIVRMVGTMAANDDADVAAYAVAVAPAMWANRRNDAPLVAVVSTAVRRARRAGALASWDQTYGDMTDLASLEVDDSRTTLGHYGTAPADAQYGVTHGDVVATAVGMVSDPGARIGLVRAASEYVRHEASGCCAGAGRRPTLAGITAHVDGVTATDSAYHASRRATLRAMSYVDRTAVLAVTGAPGARPTYGRNRVSVGNGSPAHEAPAMVGIIVTRDASGEIAARPLSDAETEAIGAPDAGRAPMVADGDSNVSRPFDAPLRGDVSQTTGMLMSGKRPESPRKRPGGNTGPTVPARLSR